MCNNNLKEPCKDCPFKKDSLGGYLGGVWDAQSLHHFVMGEQKFFCHKTIKKDDQPEEELEICLGSILYMNKNCKSARDKDLNELQTKHKETDKSNIMTSQEFLTHHSEAKIDR